MMSSVSMYCGPVGDAGGGEEGGGETFELVSSPMDEKMPRLASIETDVKPRAHTMRPEKSNQFRLNAIAF